MSEVAKTYDTQLINQQIGRQNMCQYVHTEMTVPGLDFQLQHAFLQQYNNAFNTS